MSPEQGAEAELTPASDWYSVGVILFQALTGRLPFVGKPLQILLDKQQYEPPAPNELVMDVPEDLNELCRQLLRRDPEKRPAGREVLRRLGVDSAAARVSLATSTSSSEKAPFVGREDHMNRLAESFRDMRQGRTVVVNLQGRSGVGKSALVQHFLTDIVARDQDVAVLFGRCYERESVPFKAVDSLIDALCRLLLRLDSRKAAEIMPRDVLALASVFPVLRRVETVASAPRRRVEIPNQHELRLRAFRALRELLSRLGDRMPVVLAIDDLQWGDRDSGALLSEVLRPPDPPVLLLLLSFRSDAAEKAPLLMELREVQRSMAHSLDVRRLSVEPLTELEAVRLACDLLSQHSPKTQQLAELFARESGGNPYFVDALVREWEMGSHVREQSVDPQAISLNDVLWSRAQRLPDAAMRLLELVSLAGRPLRRAVVLEAAGLQSDGHRALDVLRVARLVHTTGSDTDSLVETYHDRVRETIVERLSEPTVIDCHCRLALALERAGSVDAALLAAHFHGAEMLDKARDYYALAADQASDSLAFDRASELYRTALRLDDGDALRQHRLKCRLGEALANAGRGREAAEQYLEAADGCRAGDALELRRRAAMELLTSGHIDDGLDALCRVMDMVGMRLPATPTRALASLLWQRTKLRVRGLAFRRRDSTQTSMTELVGVDVCWTAAFGLGLVDTIRGAAFQTRNLLMALRVGEPYRIARALATEAAYVATAGVRTRQRVDGLLQQADQLAVGIAVPHAIGLVALMRGIAEFLQGRWKPAMEHCDRADDVFRNECTGMAYEMITAHRFAHWSLVYLGHVAELSRRLPRLVNEARDKGNLYALNDLGTVAGPTVRMAADDPAGAEEELLEASRLCAHRGFHIQHLNGLYGGTQVKIYKGCSEEALRELQEQWPALKRSQLLRVQQVRVILNHVYARAALDFAARSKAKRKPLLRFSQRTARMLEAQKGCMWAQALACLIRAGIASCVGEESSVVDSLKRAMRGFETTDMLLYAASARRRLGEVLGGDEGRQLIREADDWMASQEIRNPARMAAMHAPGFPV